MKKSLLTVSVLVGITGFCAVAFLGHKKDITQQPTSGHVSSFDSGHASASQDSKTAKADKPKSPANDQPKTHQLASDADVPPKLHKAPLPSAPSIKAEADASEQIYRALYLPNDQPDDQWYPAKIKATNAWDKTTGSASTTVAVIDTGFALDHDELFDRWATNSGETGSGKETNGIDDDSNGLVDDWRGWDFYHGDKSPAAGSDDVNGDAVSHGTSVSGLVGIAGNNGMGAASVNWQTKLLPIQVLNDYGFGTSSDVALAIHYAVDQGADIISMSLGTDLPDTNVQNEIDYATANGVLVVAAAGNDGCNCLAYPANYPAVLAVGASTSTDNIASFSSYGSNLDVVAPGAGIMYSSRWLASRHDGYSHHLYGTSFATPIVSGLAAMIKGLDNSLTPTEITNYIKNQADALDTAPIYQGSGRINVYASITASVSPLANNPPSVTTAPLYHLSKTGEDDEYTAVPDRRDKWVQDGYEYEIIRQVTQ